MKINILIPCAFILSLLTLSHASAAQVLSLDVQGSGLTASEQTKLQAFISEIEAQLSAPIKNRILHDLPAQKGEYSGVRQQKVRLQLAEIKGEVGGIKAPACEAIDNMPRAQELKKELKQVIETRGLGSRIRYDEQVQSYLQISKDGQSTIVLNRQFLPIILNGESAAEKFPCGHRNMYKLAQASVVHGLARVIDAKKFQSQAEQGMISGRNNQCSRIAEAQKQNRGKSGRLNWTDGQLYCADLQESDTLISERNRYRVLATGWDGKKGSYMDSQSAFWPRAVNKYAFAYDVQNHFAHTFEFFILDPTFACRMPNIHEHIVKSLSDGTGQSVDLQQAVASGKCKVNTRLRVVESLTDDSATPFIDISWYDLDPKKVAGIDYFRAGAGTGAASLFGHSMFRVRGVTPDALMDGCLEAQAEYNLGPCDLILNHRANPTELRLDQAQGFFGGYPSQLLVSPIYDILYEYNDSEMRHIFNLQLGQTTSRGFEPMPEDEKNRFLYAAVEQYWTYVGDYKFISNNCADEAMRLYQNASENPKLGYVNVLTPKQIDHKVLVGVGAISKQDSESVKEPGLIRRMARKVFGRSQNQYQRERRRMEKNDLVELSKRYSFYDAISEIIRLEGRTITVDQNGDNVKKPVDHTNINVIEKEASAWEKIGTVSNSSKDICKINQEYAEVHAKRSKVNSVLEDLVQRYESIFSAARAEYERTKSEEAKNKMREINQSFYVALYHADIKRQGQLGDMTVRIAYEIARPDNGKDMICKNDQAWQVDPVRRDYIKRMLDEYEVYENLTQPYSDFSLSVGYGIPLANEVRPDQFLKDFAERKKGSVVQLMLGLAPELGIDYDIYRGIRHYRYEICMDRLKHKLYGENKPECDVYFEDVVLDRQNDRTPGVFKK